MKIADEIRKSIAKVICKHCSPLADTKVLNRDIDVSLKEILKLIDKENEAMRRIRYGEKPLTW